MFKEKTGNMFILVYRSFAKICKNVRNRSSGLITCVHMYQKYMYTPISGWYCAQSSDECVGDAISYKI